VFKLKACTRCGGDLGLHQERDGDEWICMQCGRTIFIAPLTPKYTPSGLDKQLAMIIAGMENVTAW
jgi:ribosomal protein S27AE